MEARRDFKGDISLCGKNIRYVFLVALRPDLLIVRGIDQLHVDTNAIRDTLHATFHHCGDTEGFGDVANVRAIGRVNHYRTARDYL